jgi:CRP/FNR family transcriptional regulator, cyclic AMP receptor protein
LLHIEHVLLVLASLARPLAFTGRLSVCGALGPLGVNYEGTLSSLARARLLEVDRDLGDFLSAEEFDEARQLTVPVLTFGQEDGDVNQLRQPDAFSGLVLEGMVLHYLRVGDQLGLLLLGPGDIVPMKESPGSMLVAESSLQALPATRLAILGREVLLAARRWPSLLASLQLRAAQQAERLSAQLVICQLPRVDQRLLSLLWLLAESWGRVTPAGTAVPLKLTHEALGALIGARRPTITLALRDLSERGAIVRQHEGWLLLERPQEPTERSGPVRFPSLGLSVNGGSVQRSFPTTARNNRAPRPARS